VLVSAAAVCAQQAQTIVGTVDGRDVSVASADSQSAALVRADTGASTEIASGNVVTVTTGQARVMLASGGELDVCGPAKLSLVEAGDNITVGLDFGTLRVQLPLSTSLRVLTPTAVATPLDINAAPRDVTLSLGSDDSLRVNAASGALLVENQFSSEKLVIPEGGQFSFAQGKLVPLPQDSKCECIMNDSRSLPQVAGAPAIGPIAPAKTSSAVSILADSNNDDAEPSIDYSVLAHPNETHPLNPPPKHAPVSPPPDSATYKIVAPPLTFSASSPTPPPGPASGMVLLIRTVEVEPDFEFTGHINPPPIGAPSPAHEPTSRQRREPKSSAEKQGFWAKLKHFLVGSSS
jgi:hypothetical protein